MERYKIITGLLLLSAGIVLAQGSLTPPGAPAPSMKTLNQVEPRTPISSAPYTISQSGSYYLTTNLTSSGHGIIITTNGVTLDLMGFTIRGDQGIGDYGIFLDGETNSLFEQVVVKNGIIRNFGYGIRAESSQSCRFEHFISASNNNGIYLRNVSGYTITDGTISQNGTTGIYLSGLSSQCNGNVILNCTINGNGTYGIYLSGASGQCDGNTVSDCTICENGNTGIKIYGWNGQCIGNKITNCSISKNTNTGIKISYTSGSRVEGNHVSGQTGTTTYGIRTSSSSENLIFRNTCMGQTTNFALDSDDVYGPIVTSTGELSTTGAEAHPLANFSF